MAAKVARAGVERESGWLYYLDKKGNVSRVRMARGGGKVRKTKPQVVAKVGVEREEGFLYFIDKDGDVSRAKMARAGRGRSKPKARSSAKKTARRTAAKGAKSSKGTRASRR